ncbi:hypothetical protein Glove_251g19 [Diversispora epigaea]|uniref:Uncharacterized protein n=1 Tax=Diversispora epigaea TaxID=1348612 RepID=A0A397IEP5_9GLOM|nr:hypothetical protein Glove_251g19 [Diversispora epigaea]
MPKVKKCTESSDNGTYIDILWMNGKSEPIQDNEFVAKLQGLKLEIFEMLIKNSKKSDH